MGELAMRPIDGSPLLRDRQDGVDLGGDQTMHRVPTRGQIRQRAQITSAGPPTVHPVVGHLPQLARPAMREPARDRVIDDFEDQLFDLGGDPRRNRTRQPQADFPRTTASSIAWAVTAWVN